MSYRKNSRNQYDMKRKPYGWPLAYERKGKYSVVQRGYVPKSAEFVDLVVPVRKDLQLPVDVKVVQRSKPIGKEERLIVRVPRERLRDFNVEGLPAEVMEPQPKRPKTVTEYDQQIGVIRKALKELCPTLSVRRGSGTAYGWIDILGSGEFHNFTEQEKKALDKFGLNYGGNAAVISPESRAYWVEVSRRVLAKT